MLVNMANPYFITRNTMGSQNEQNLLEDLIIESIEFAGVEMFYIPRTIVAKDEILGEDRLSEFNNVYGVTVYFENIDNFEGQGSFMSKFGLFNEQAATVSLARKKWQDLVGRFGTSNLPTRPSEGDLLYFPMTKGLFEIKFVQDKDPFYQLGKLYVYKLNIELYQYASEKINTGIPEIDAFEDLKSHDITINSSPDEPGNYGDNDELIAESEDIGFNTANPFGDSI